MYGILFTLVKEATMIMIHKVSWDVVFERFYSRALIYSLVKLKDLSTNEVVDDTIQDVIDSLKGKRLKVIEGEIK